jgi:hypothetical protein
VPDSAGSGSPSPARSPASPRASILDAAWRQGQELDLAGLIQQLVVRGERPSGLPELKNEVAERSAAEGRDSSDPSKRGYDLACGTNLAHPFPSLTAEIGKFPSS